MKANERRTGSLPVHWPGLLFGLFFAVVTLTPGYVAGTGPAWETVAGDGAQHEIGWFYYARDAWRFPLFTIGNYHSPEGANIALTDSIPLFAIPAKLLYQAAFAPGSVPPIYTGLWTALCFLLQAVAASRLLRTLGVSRPVPHLAGIALLCYMPMLLIRFGGHSALLGQFLILLALDGYLRARRSEPGRGSWAALCLLPAAALLVHPYLAAMTSALVLTTLLDQWHRRSMSLAACALRAAAVLGSLALVYVIGGYASFAGNTGSDYGYYSLNLLSPWVPFPQTLSGQWLGTQIPSAQGLYQWEGGCYLGAGFLLLLAIALFDPRNAWAAVCRHTLLFVVLVFFILFAVSHRVGFGASEVLHVPLPQRVIGWFSALRGSGRFVWVPVYVLACWLIVATMRRFGTKQATALLVVAALLQILDVGAMQIGVRKASATAATPSIDRAKWAALIGTHARIFQFPSFECGALFGRGVPGNRFRELEIEWIAAKLDKPTNSAYLARFTKDCAQEHSEAVSRYGEAGVLYLYRSDDETGGILARAGFDLSRCGYLDDVAVCSGDIDLSKLDDSAHSP